VSRGIRFRLDAVVAVFGQESVVSGQFSVKFPLGGRGSCRAVWFMALRCSSAQQELRPPENVEASADSWAVGFASAILCLVVAGRHAEASRCWGNRGKGG
jgi:hypothetical protein